MLDNNPHISKTALEDIHGELFGWSLSRCGFDNAVAENLMQQAYVELLSGRAKFDNQSALKTFVFGVVHNLTRSRFRQQSTHLRLIDTFAVEQDDSSEGDHEHESLKAFWEAVESLPQRQRDITELVFIRDMTIEAAAHVMGVSLGIGRVNYDRAKKALAKKLEQLHREEFL